MKLTTVEGMQSEIFCTDHTQTDIYRIKETFK